MAVSEILPESWQVFINFRGKELRGNFISHLEGALNQAEISYYIDAKETPSGDLSVLFTRIEQSKIALVIFSSMYAESKWCLDELVKIMEQVKKEKLRIIPVFYNVTPEEVREQKGEFGLKLYGEGKRKRPNIPDWENALQSVPSKIGLSLASFRNERELVEKIVESVKRVLAIIPPVSRGGEGGDVSTNISSLSFNGDVSSAQVEEPTSPPVDYGMIQRLRVKKDSVSENVDAFSLQDPPRFLSLYPGDSPPPPTTTISLRRPPTTTI